MAKEYSTVLVRFTQRLNPKDYDYGKIFERRFYPDEHYYRHRRPMICRGCGRYIYPGDSIWKTSTTGYGYLHRECGVRVEDA